MAAKKQKKELKARFFQSDTNNEPVRDWIVTLSKADRKVIGAGIKEVQIGWPMGMPLVKKMEADLWEVRILLDHRKARILFTMINGDIVLLHGFIKKSQNTPLDDLKVARARKRQLK